MTVTAAITATILAHKGEPSYNGYRLNCWVRAISAKNTQDFGPDCTYIEAPAAFRSMGSNCVPYLVDWASYKGGPAPVRDAVKWGIAKCPWLGRIKSLKGWALFDTKETKADGVIVAFAFLRESGAPAIPSLLKLATTPTKAAPQYRALYSLVNIGATSLSALLAIATNCTANATIRREATVCIGYFGIRAEFAIPDLLTVLHDPDANVASGAAEALGRLRLQSASVVPALTFAARHSTGAFQRTAIRALGNFDSQATEAIPALREIARTNDRALRFCAASAIAAIELQHVSDVSAEVERQHFTGAIAH